MHTASSAGESLGSWVSSSQNAGGFRSSNGWPVLWFQFFQSSEYCKLCSLRRRLTDISTKWKCIIGRHRLYPFSKLLGQSAGNIRQSQTFDLICADKSILVRETFGSKEAPLPLNPLSIILLHGQQAGYPSVAPRRTFCRFEHRCQCRCKILQDLKSSAFHKLQRRAGLSYFPPFSKAGDRAVQSPHFGTVRLPGSFRWMQCDSWRFACDPIAVVRA